MRELAEAGVVGPVGMLLISATGSNSTRSTVSLTATAEREARILLPSAALRTALLTKIFLDVPTVFL